MRRWQIRLSTDGRHPMFPSEQALREAVRSVAFTAGREIVLFCIVDDHLHVVLFCERQVVTWRARSLCRVVRGRSPALISPSYISPVRSRQHMENLVGYLLNQTAHHGLPGHPALWTGSCFADLVGARVLPGLDLQIARALPRLQLQKICAAVGLNEGDVQPLELDAVRALGVSRIQAAASAVLAVGPEPKPRARGRFLVRSITAQLGRDCGTTREETGWVLDCTRRHVLRLEEAPIGEGLLRATRTRLALEEAVARSAVTQRGHTAA
jgi:REP element-mobilizing transposase RayT